SLRILVRGIGFRMRFDKVDHLLLIEHVIERKTHVFRADQVGDVIDVPDDQFCGDVVFAKEYANAIDTDHATSFRASADCFVTDVARMVPQGARIGVGKDYRLTGALEDLHGAALPDVRATYDHSDSFHFF